MAIKFGPELVETQLAKAYYKYYCERDYEGAKAQLNRFVGNIQTTP